MEYIFFDNNEEYLINEIKKNIINIKYISKNILKNSNFILKVLSDESINPSFVDFIESNIVDEVLTREVIDKLIERNYILSTNSPRKLKDNEDLVLSLLKSGQFIFFDLYKYISPRLNKDIKFIIFILDNVEIAPEFVDFLFIKNFLLNEKLVDKLIEKKYYLNSDSSSSFKDNERIVLHSIKDNPELFRYASERLKESKEFIKLALENKVSLKMLAFANITEEIYEFIKEYFSLDEQKLKLFESTFGFEITIKFIINDVDKLINIINLEDTNFNKFINLFSFKEFTMSNVEAVYDSVEQSKIDPNIFSYIIHSIDKDIDYLNYLKEIILYLDESFLKDIQNELKMNFSTPLELLIYITNQFKLNVDSKEKYLNILHKITNYYLKKAREALRKNYDIYHDMKILYKLDEKSLEKNIISILTSQNDYLPVEKNIFNSFVNYYLTKELKWDDKNFLLLSLIFQNKLKDVDKKVVKKLMKEFNIACHEAYIQNKSKLSFNEKFLEEKLNLKVKKIPILKDSLEKRYRILSEIKIDYLVNNLFTDEECYNLLKEIISKRQILTIPNCVLNYLENNINSGEEFYLSIFSSFINFFQEIYKDEKNHLNNLGIKTITKENFNLLKVIKYGKMYSGLSTVYNFILTDEDANLIKLNPEPYTAYNITEEERLKKAVKLTISNFKRQEITIPSFAKEYKIADKIVVAQVGNFTDPSNLTHGERTGSCMRIGGIGNSLLEFALTNRNGFHIIFRDNQGRYLSRVTGFRNGNTVFLNELRYSCNNDYSNDDIINACKYVSKDLVNYSKKSTLPIDNVVIHREFAMKDIPESNIIQGNIKNGLPHFYSDIGNKVILLATSNEDGKLVPFDSDKTNLPIYKPFRKQILKTDDKYVIGTYVRRINSIKKILNGEEYEYICSINLSEIKEAYLNDDWYICIDNNGNIYTDIIDIDKRAQVEFDIIKNMIDELSKKGNLQR